LAGGRFGGAGEGVQRAALAEDALEMREGGFLELIIDAGDMLVLTMSVLATAGLAAAARRSDIRRRVLGIVLDGLRPARTGPTALLVPP
jgi:hypothetical protein